MSAFLQAIQNRTTTTNGMAAFKSTMDPCLDLFYKAPASRKSDVTAEFIAAVNHNNDVALRILLWLRDVRGGAGERQTFRNLYKVYIEQVLVSESAALKILEKIPEIGRFDDLLWILENVDNAAIREKVVAIYKNELDKGNGLAFKWLPVKNKFIRNCMGFKKEAAWRKFVVAGRKTVEQQMCANQWDEINFNQVPSVAAARYKKAFDRRTKNYAAYVEGLATGETKINAGAVYPYDILRSWKSCRYSYDATIIKSAEAQWLALPNYVNSDERVLPVIDVSGSMDCQISGNITAMDVAVSLGMYLANRLEGPFKNHFITFNDKPEMLNISGAFNEDLLKIYAAPWGGSTDIERTFDLILNSATSHNVPQEEMPTKIIIFSDMQFNQADRIGYTAVEMMRKKYTEHGYTLPTLVFWNVAGGTTNIPITVGQQGVILGSGFSPSLMKSILGGATDAMSMMLETVMVDRYSLD